MTTVLERMASSVIKVPVSGGAFLKE